MPTLLLRLCGPMQSWGTQSNFVHRDTGYEPSKSAIIGLICAALGRERHKSLEDLANLNMGVRVDQAGTMLRDFHTAGSRGIYTVEGKVKNSLVLSERYYLNDAKFLVGLEGDLDILRTLQKALQKPKHFLFLGRKAFIPSERVWLPDGLQELTLLKALESYPWLGKGLIPLQLRLVFDDVNGSIVRHDVPISFKPPRFLARTVQIIYIDIFTRV